MIERHPPGNMFTDSQRPHLEFRWWGSDGVRECDAAEIWVYPRWGGSVIAVLPVSPQTEEGAISAIKEWEAS